MSTHARTPRRGFTLAELLVVIVLLGLVGSAITTVVIRQQRFYRGANEIIDTRSQIRQAASILPTELRGISSAAGDLVSIAPMQLEFKAPIGSSIACQLLNGASGAATQVALPPATLASGNTLTSFLNVPTPGDLAFVYNDWGTADDMTDDRWFPTTVAAIDSVRGIVCLPATGFTLPTDGTGWRIRVTFAAAPPNLVPGTVIRFARPVRYSLYQASDEQWYLGYEQFGTPTAGAWSGVQPVSGPYLAGDAATEGNRGLRFRVFDQTGAELTALPAPGAPPITRVDIVVRGETRQPVQLSGTAPTQQFRDSLNVSVAIRNWQ